MMGLDKKTEKVMGTVSGQILKAFDEQKKMLNQIGERIELLTTIPTKLVKPINAVNEKEFPVISKAKIEPIIASGIAEKTMSGCENDLNCKTRTPKIPIRAMITALIIPPKDSSRLSNSPLT